MTTIDALTDVRDRLTRLVRALHTENLANEPKKTDPKRYTMREVETLVQRSYRAIRDAELSGKLPAPKLGPNKRRLGYTLADINRARELFGTRLQRGEGDETIRLAFANFKGGSAKTTTAVHAAEYFAEAGLRTLLVDCDPQGSATATFGYYPDGEIEPDDTLLPYMEGTRESLDYAVRPTYWDGLDLIPANLFLFDAEYGIAADASTGLQRLRVGIESVEDRYDAIILDSPPALGMLSLSVMHAANAIVIPTAAANYDLYSTRSFSHMLVEIAETLTRKGVDVDFKFVRLLITRLDENSESQTALVDILPDFMGQTVMRQMVRKTAALDRAGLHGRTLYEVSAEQMPRRTWKRALAHVDRANAELIHLVRRTWPSHEDAMRQAAEI